jgi:hypothetical protein
MPDIVLKWDGREYRIPESRAFEAGAALEEVVTLAELQSYGTRPKFFRIAMAMGALLRFAGCKVSDAEVKREIDASIQRIAAAQGAEAGEVEEVFAVTAVGQLISVLFQGAPTETSGDAPGETSAS